VTDGGAGATGTIGQIAKFTSTTDVGNSVISEVAGNIGIGTTPSSGIKLEVNGTTLISPAGTAGVIQFGNPASETGMSILGSNRADVRFDGSTLKLVAGPLGGPPPAERNGHQYPGQYWYGDEQSESKLMSLEPRYSDQVGAGSHSIRQSRFRNRHVHRRCGQPG
jgi:hypothetical protein